MRELNFWEFSSNETEAYQFSNDDFHGVIDLFGRDLYVLDIDLGDNVSHATLERLVHVCTAQLRILAIRKCVIFTDALVMQLADKCHHVYSLSLTGAIDITNAGMCYFLERMGPRLVDLCIRQCHKLTYPTVIAIAEHCSLLEMLDIRETGITAPAVMEHVIKPNQLTELGLFTVDFDTSKALSDLMGGEGNEADKRWQEVLEGRF